MTSGAIGVSSPIEKVASLPVRSIGGTKYSRSLGAEAISSRVKRSGRSLTVHIGSVPADDALLGDRHPFATASSSLFSSLSG